MNPEDMIKARNAMGSALQSGPFRGAGDVNPYGASPSFSVLPVKNGYVVTWRGAHYVAETLDGVIDVIKQVQVTERVSA